MVTPCANNCTVKPQSLRSTGYEKEGPTLLNHAAGQRLNTCIVETTTLDLLVPAQANSFVFAICPKGLGHVRSVPVWPCPGALVLRDVPAPACLWGLHLLTWFSQIALTTFLKFGFH